MWLKPWKYKEGLLIGGGLVVTGVMLQASIGRIEWGQMAYPTNLILLGVALVGIGLMHALRKRVYLFRWLSSYTAAVSALCWVAGLTVLMGLTRQAPSYQTLTGTARLFGISQMLSMWSFVLVYVWMTIILSLTILRVCGSFHWRRIPFLLNHLGLLIALVAATLGNADIRRLRMTTTLGQAEWRASDETTQEVVELPLAIELNNFDIEEYPPKLMLIDNETGEVLPKGSGAHILLEEGVDSGRLGEWEVRITEQIAEAASVATEDSIRFTEFLSRGATYAAYIEAVHMTSHEKREGWVSCGSFIFPYKALRLNDEASIVMPDREPRRFCSDVTLYTESGLCEEGQIEVNKPYELEGWKIYQLSYDENLGRWSSVSILELVRDPWLPVVYVGIGMMILGAACLFITAQTSERKEERA